MQAESTEKAEKLAKQLLEAGLIADSEIISSGIKRFYLKDDESVQNDSLVMLKLITT